MPVCEILPRDFFPAASKRDFTMLRIISVVLFAVCANVWVAPSSRGQTDAPGSAADPDAPAESQQPEAMELLREMAKYLGDLQAYSCRVQATITIQASGEENRIDSKLLVRLQHPNQIAILVEEGETEATVVSDGKQVVQYMPMLNRYTVQEAPDDFAGLSRYAKIMSLGTSPASITAMGGDRFSEALTSDITKAEYLGTQKIGKATCHHCRFVKHGLNFEIWIETGDRPLPRRLVPDISDQLPGATTDYSVVFSDWDVSPKFTGADFAFSPPGDAEKVDSLFEGLGGGGEVGPHPLLGQAAPAFETIDLEGRPLDLQQHLGKSMILLDFWATWCGPCVEAMPSVDAVAEKYRDRGLVFFAVNVGEETAAVSEFLTKSKLDVPVAMDSEGKISELYQVEGIPQTVLVGKDGKVQVVHVGFSTDLSKQLTQNIEDLLAGKDLASETLAAAEKNKDGESPAAESADEQPEQ
jgi:peroxiredoxin